MEYIGAYSTTGGPYAVKLSICGEGVDIFLDAGSLPEECLRVQWCG